MTEIAFWDTETNGLLQGKWEKGEYVPPMDKMHCIAVSFWQMEANTWDHLEAHNGNDVTPASKDGDASPYEGYKRVSMVTLIKRLEAADTRVAHNGQDFDENAILIPYPWFNPKEGSNILDTLILSRVIYPDIHRTGPNSFGVPGNMKRQHSLAAWGFRLGEHKGDYKGGWVRWTEEMQAYMVQDVAVLVKLFRWLMSGDRKPDPRCSSLEHEFAGLIRRQERRGFAFDHEKALQLQASLTSLEETLEAKLIEAFGEWWEHGKPAHPSAHNPYRDETDGDDEVDDPEVQEKRRLLWEERKDWGEMIVPTKSRAVKMMGFPDITQRRVSATTGKELMPYVGPPKIYYTQGEPYTPIKRVQFNPGSRAHIRKRLIAKYGWKPERFTKPPKKGVPQPIVDDDVLRALPYPEAQMLADYYLVLKRLGALCAGKKAWLKVARETREINGTSTYRVHGRVNTNGAATGRCTHSDPNLAQVPKNTAGQEAVERTGQEFLSGAACRDLFIAREPYKLVGFDGASLELCMLAHYVSKWDHGEYADVIDKGDKSKGTDPHSWLRDLVGTNLLGAGDLGRNNAKTTMYAFVFGAGDPKLGSIVLPQGNLTERREVGREVRDKVMSRFTAMGNLQTAIVQAVEDRKFLVGLDGRILRVRKPHAALNTLLQSAGAIVMKKSLVLLDISLRREGLQCGHDYEFVANVHDEAQAEVLPEYATLYAHLAEQCVPEAGKELKVKCPLRAESSIGRSWKETH